MKNFKDAELEAYANQLKENGFRVFTLEEPTTLFKFEKDGKLGYCQLDRLDAFCFSTVHKPNRKTGTGFSIHRGVCEPTEQHALDCFVFAPNWASREDISSVEKYNDMEDYLKKETVLKYKEI